MILGIMGHRPSKIGGYITPNPIYNYVMNEMQRHFIELEPDCVITGMAIGIDQMAAELAIELNIPFTAAIPFIGQWKIWPEASQLRYHELLAKASSSHIVSEGGFAAWKLQRRNEWVVDNSDIMLAVWDGSKGGTCNAMSYAMNKGVRVIHIDPRKAQ